MECFACGTTAARTRGFKVVFRPPMSVKSSKRGKRSKMIEVKESLVRTCLREARF